MKKAGIFDPYLDTLGGGERYAITVAHCLAKKGWQVDVFWDDRGIGKKLEKRLGIDLKKISFVPNFFKENFFKKMSLMKNYDLLFYVSDGSIPSLFAKKNLLHFQVPFHDVGGRKPLNKVKLKRIKTIICNSQLTKRFIDKEYGVQSQIVYPPVAVKEFKSGEKKNIIFSVGRFSQLIQSKRQDVLIDVFGQIAKELGDWQLILAGGTDIGKDEAFDLLKQKAKKLPVEIIESPPFSELKKLYAQAKIFWTAAGFGVDEEQNPEKVEHFGITTVEAMAAGCVPIVINKGGQPEIVNHQKDGLLWKSKEELIEQTLKVARDNKLRERLAAGAKKRAQVFSQEHFCQEIVKLAQ
ncbi:MAG TPA: glycosyltransferase family 4 protein [Patescibacteria group bacterium]|nr:glycosyltransferase family 4 protein [Patescibacteria group bacterium]